MRLTLVSSSELDGDKAVSGRIDGTEERRAKGGMMVGSRWSRRLLLSCGLFMAATVSVLCVAQESLPDLSIREIALDPAAIVIKGDIVRVTATVLHVGEPTAVATRIELSWRRLDKQEPCGLTVETVTEERNAAGETFVEAWIDTDDLLDGEYEIIAVADPDNWIAEADETNNRLVGHMEVRSPRPELHPLELEAVPASPLLWGETATLGASVANTGRLASGAFHIEFLLFPVYCEDPDTKESWSISALVDEAATSERGEWLFQLDPEQGMAGLVEAIGQLPAGAWIPFSSARIPGLERDESIEATAPFWTGQTLRDSLSGAQSTISGSAMEPLADDEMDRLERCITTYAIRVVIGEPEGTAEQDGTNNELITAITVHPSTLELPELLPLQITFDEDLPLDWDKDMDVEVIVMNRGGSAAPIVAGGPGIGLAFYYRAQGTTTWLPLDALTVARLGIEEDSNTTTEETTIDARSDRLGLEPGSYELRVVVDEEGLIPEQNEENNELVVGFSVRGTELHPISLDGSSEPIRQGDTITVTALIENTGDRSQHDFNVGFYLDDTRFDTFYYRASTATEDGLEEADRTRAEGVLSTTDFPPGMYTLRVVVDPDERVSELDEGNNVISTSLRILPPAERLAELQVTEIELAPASPIGMYEAVTVAAMVRNAGRIDAQRFQVMFDLAYSADGVEWVNPSLSWGESGSGVNIQNVQGLARSARRVVRQILSPEQWVDGQYRLTASVDVSDEVQELDERNNETVIFFTVGDIVRPDGTSGIVTPSNAPNLVCGDVTASPATSVDVGTSVQIRSSVTNLGRQPAGAFQVSFDWIDPYGAVHRLETQTIAGLGVGQSVALSYSVDTSDFPAGAHQALIEVDGEGRIDESTKHDNICYQTIQVGPVVDGHPFRPDLVPISVRFDSPGVSLDDSNTVQQNQRLYAYVTVRNEGNVASGPLSVAFVTPSDSTVEQWTSIGPQDQAEISAPMRTGTAGTFSLSILIDPDDLVAEEDETNNGIPNEHTVELPYYTVVGLASPKPLALISQLGSAVRWLAANPSSAAVYAVSVDGQVYDVGSTGIPEQLGSTGGPVTDVEWSFGSVPYAHILTSTGSVSRFDLSSGRAVTEATLGQPGVAMAVGDSGRIYVAGATGFYQLTLSGSSYVVSPLVPVPGTVIDIRYDASRQVIYVLSSRGLFSYGIDLGQRCLLDETAVTGIPTAYASGAASGYLGTAAGSGWILYALGHCSWTDDEGGQIPLGWRYPHTGSQLGKITSIIIDARDIDPVYVATDAGSLYSLDFNGGATWTYGAAGAIHSRPVADKRTGRIFFGDDSGIPHVLTFDGAEAFEIDLTGYVGGAIRSTLVITETRERTDLGARLVRNYYYGTEDGAVYKLASQQ